ncbi:hypothetical protein H5410_010493 [Solanum commersonii]|uniref:Uncharacterized protein n=1 Tax=Solanum commersonii TaxID=4109 RepID=A0A9J6ALW9_SOLCO|nr:hypothetical protein H5410_010493 [Solanum commersonii]
MVPIAGGSWQRSGFRKGSLESLTLNFGVSDLISKLNMQAQLCTIAVNFKNTAGAFRESNSGPLAPEARIIPLDQMPMIDKP